MTTGEKLITEVVTSCGSMLSVEVHSTMMQTYSSFSRP
jgi:hypothetical protein